MPPHPASCQRQKSPSRRCRSTQPPPICNCLRSLEGREGQGAPAVCPTRRWKGAQAFFVAAFLAWISPSSRRSRYALTNTAVVSNRGTPCPFNGLQAGQARLAARSGGGGGRRKGEHPRTSPTELPVRSLTSPSAHL